MKKRLLDIFFSAGLLLLFFPVLLVISVILLVTPDSNIFFLQERAGRNGNLFTLIKFQTMTESRNENGFLLPDHLRLTKTGAWLRKTSLDELPQLLNVLLGNMSLVGPRPLLPEYLPLYSREHNRRHEVLPGITGWAQVHGRNAVAWENKFAYDVWYVDNHSLRLDLAILLKTIKPVLFRQDVYPEKELFVEKFTGIFSK